MQVSKIANLSNNFRNYNSSIKAQPSFSGHWVETKRCAEYPYESTVVKVETYVPDENETLDEIKSEFYKRAYTTDIFRNGLTYTLQTNYFCDWKKSNELVKINLTNSAENNIRKARYVEAVDDKLEIARILKKQGMERDKFLIEEGIREIYQIADAESRSKIEDLVEQYNPEMAQDLDKVYFD